MAKILLVEDDNNLREIYEARLMAEGYDIVSARDGEEALSVAIKEKPDLVISDVMMPKISGFDMLDILRTTEETKNIKVIMMTALSQAEDKARAEKLGADRYLVKSQVTLEDVAKVAKEVLEGSTAPAPEPASSDATTSATPTPVTPPAEPAVVTPAPEPASTVPAPAPEPASSDATTSATPTPVTPPAEPAVVTPAPEPASSDATTSATPTPVTPPAEPAVVTPAPEPEPTSSSTASESASSPEEDEGKAIAQQIEGMLTSNKDSSTVVPPVEEPTPASTTSENNQSATNSEPTKSDRVVIQPINDLNVDNASKLQDLADKEEVMSSPQSSAPAPVESPQPESSPKPIQDVIMPTATIDTKPAQSATQQSPAPNSSNSGVDPNAIAL